MNLSQYIKNLDERYRLGNATEHTFRGDLQQLIESLVPNVRATNEPKRQRCGAPDYILTRKDIPVGFIEAKDIGDHDLDGTKKSGNKEQFDRYKASLSNLIFTDYINFHFYRDGEFVTKISIGEITDRGINPLPDHFNHFESLLNDFCTQVSQSIKSPKKLAEMMAGKARLLAEIIGNAVTSDEENQEDSTLKEQMQAFKQILIHDITPQGFADVYAQTIAYGMFAARLHDPTLENFSRQEAAELIPKSNPFLRKLFGYIAGPDIDDRIKWVVENLSEIFLASNVQEILKNYGKSTKMEDPILHFYETFLSEYDPRLRKSRGVWYTPQPVVDFIVRAVDDILKTEFDLPQGLADTSKTKIKVNSQIADNRSKTGYKQIDKEVHKVQILDPATGTGTFLAEVVKHIYKKFQSQQGIWSNYVENHLIPRLNGFELLMASYAMAHLKLDLLLSETGFKPTSNQRLRIYLTNSLEEYHQDTGTLWDAWLSTEASEANHIKRDTPVMCVIGNPPYSGTSSNNGEWIKQLIGSYKKEPDGSKLKEQNSKYLNDDYVKFIRYSEYMINKNGEGILAFITNNGYIDNPTFRGMRAALSRTFNDIFVLDLHGSTKKKEKSPDGTPDQNVFDIMQGVAIIIATKKNNSNEVATIHHADCYGKRSSKYEFLSKSNFKDIKFETFKPSLPFYTFFKVNTELQERYYSYLSLDKLFPANSVGVKTSRDSLLIAPSKTRLREKLKFFLENDSTTVSERFGLRFSTKWSHENLITELSEAIVENDIRKISYRPFDNQYICYNSLLVDRDRKKVLKHLERNNQAIIVGRQGQAVAGDTWNLIFTSESLSDMNIFARGGGVAFPLYLYNESLGTQDTFEKIPNINKQLIRLFEESIGIPFSLTSDHRTETFSPEDLFDYIYAVLHSSIYRNTYDEFLKIDFPRIPLPKNSKYFKDLVALGSELRDLHLLGRLSMDIVATEYPVDGNNIVEKIVFNGDAVYINSTQFFKNVSEESWQFYIGGYQPAQKWLKDRKGRQLDFEDILHYQKIIVALTETDRIMKEIDKIDFI